MSQNPTDYLYVGNTRTHVIVYKGNIAACKKVIEKYKSRRYKIFKYSEIPANYIFTFHINSLERMHEPIR
jgi:hypothetical protein